MTPFSKLSLMHSHNPPTLPSLITTPHLITPPPKTRSLADIHQDILITMRVRLCALAALVWDYADTLLDLAKAAKLHSLKQPCRDIRTLRNEYFYRRQQNSETPFFKHELNWALDFELFITPITEEYLNALKQELNQLFSGLNEQEYWLTVAANQALCMLEALQAYAKGCDKSLAKFGIDMTNKTMLPPSFQRLYPILHKFCRNIKLNPKPRQKAANEIAVELAKIVVHDNAGDLLQP